MRICRLCSGNNFFFGCVFVAVTQIFHNRSVEQPAVLKNHSVAFSEVVTGDIHNVNTVNADFAAVRVIKSHKKIDECCLAATCRTDNGNVTAALDIKRKVCDERFFFCVGEVYILNLDIAFAMLKLFCTVVGNFVICLKNLKNSSCRRNACLQLREYACNLVKRLCVLICVGKEA